MRDSVLPPGHRHVRQVVSRISHREPLEALEQRRLLSVSVANGTLNVTGDASAETFDVTLFGLSYVVNRNGAVLAYVPTADVQKLFIDGASGTDKITSNIALRSTLLGGDGHDTITGGAGNDCIRGGAGDDALNGARGDDSLDGGGGNNVLTGGEGMDAADFSAQFALTIGLDGPDIYAELSEQRTVRVVRNAGSGGIDRWVSLPSQTLDSPERVIGTDGADLFENSVVESGGIVLSSIAADVRLDGRGGNDTFRIYANIKSPATNERANVTLIGGDGNDRFRTVEELGPRAILGGNGDDFVEDSGAMSGGEGAGAFVYFKLDLGPGFDTDDVSHPTDPSTSLLSAGPGVEMLIGNQSAQSQRLIGNELNNILVGGGYADTLIGNGGNDTLIGNEGADVLQGGTGDDLLDGENRSEFSIGGRLSADQLFGDAGNDTADYSQRGLSLRLSLDNTANDGTPGENDNIHSDVENILGGNAHDSITGSAANNRLVGNNGNDTVTGLGGNDQLLGSAGNDRLLALDGLPDTVDGRIGTDVAERDNSASVSDIVLSIESFI